jgi:hypothetical protein
MDRECEYGCGALLWSNETNKCCHNGKVDLGELPAIPPLLEDLMTDATNRGIHFRQHIRAYNNLFACSSVGAKINDDLAPVGGVYTYRLNGQMVHRLVARCISKHPCLFIAWARSIHPVVSTRPDSANSTSTMARSKQTDGMESCPAWTAL